MAADITRDVRYAYTNGDCLLQHRGRGVRGGSHRRREGFAQTGGGAVLVRRGASNTPLIGAELSSFLARRTFASFELTPTTFRLDEADTGLRSRLCEAYGWVDDEHLVERLAEAGFVTYERSEALLTVVGALVLAPEPQAIGGRPHIDIRRFAEGEADPDKTCSVSAIVGVRRVELPRLPHRALANP